MTDFRPLGPTVAFDSELTQAMGVAFDQAIQTLGSNCQLTPLTAELADRILDIASTGERDPVRLRDEALSFFKQRSTAS